MYTNGTEENRVFKPDEYNFKSCTLFIFNKSGTTHKKCEFSMITDNKTPVKFVKFEYSTPSKYVWLSEITVLGNGSKKQPDETSADDSQAQESSGESVTSSESTQESSEQQSSKDARDSSDNTGTVAAIAGIAVAAIAAVAVIISKIKKKQKRS